MLYPYLPVVGFIGTAIALVPLPRQIRARNVSTIALSLWIFISSFINSINTVIWAGNVNNSAPVWCDISTRLRDAALVGLPAATFCICKHLELISSRRIITSETGQRLRRKIFECAMCFALPCLWLLVYYCFQTDRFVIVENLGCYAKFFPSDIATLVTLSMPLSLSVGTLIYGSLALSHLIKDFRISSKLLGPHLQSRDAALSSPQYYRLMGMSTILGVWAVIWFTLEIKYTSEFPSLPLESWKAIHSANSIVLQFPKALLGPIYPLYLTLWWGIPGTAYLFFLLFATSQDVFSEYQRLWTWFRVIVLRRPVSEKSTTLSSIRFKSTSHVLPIHIDTTVIDDPESSRHSFKNSTKQP